MAHQTKASEFWSEAEEYHALAKHFEKNIRRYYPDPKCDFKWDRPMERIEVKR